LWLLLVEKMSISGDSSVAEAVGRRILERNGSDLIEFFYLLDEKNTLALLREFVVLRDDDQAKIIEFFRKMNQRGDLKLAVGRDGLSIRPGG
jgi:hypothetical protein